MKEAPLTLAAASVSTSKAWESWWKSSATRKNKARGENGWSWTGVVLSSSGETSEGPVPAHGRPTGNGKDTTGYPYHVKPSPQHRHTGLGEVGRPLPPQVLEGLTCSGVVWIFVRVAGKCFLSVCLLHLEESDNIVVSHPPRGTTGKPSQDM